MKTFQILIALINTILVYHVRSEDSVEVKAHSSQLFVSFEESVWVNCSTSSPEDTFYESRLRKINFQRGQNWVAAEVIVDDWENSTLFCLYVGDGEAVPSESTTAVLAYALPLDITIELKTELEEGKEYTITCTVHEVAPLEYLTINVFRGEDVIDSRSYNGPHVVGKQTVSHVYTFTASRRDNRENFTCEAVLQLGSETKSVKTPEITVQTYVRSEDSVEVKAHSSLLFVPFNESIWVNCSTSSPEHTKYESRLRKMDFQTGANWVATEVIVDDWVNSTLYCLYTVDGRASTTIVLAYALPSNVNINMETGLEEGEEYTITCTVHEVAPLEYLTINVFRGEDVIDHKSYNGPHEEGKKTEKHNYTFTASRRDNHENFTCEAVLQLGSETKRVKTPGITVQTYALPKGPVISVQKWIEKGTLTTVECQIANAFPLENVNLKMLFEDNQLNVTIDQTSKGIKNGMAELNTTYLSLGLKTIRCESNLFTLTQDSTVEVNIYEHPAFIFGLSSDIVDLHQKVTASCNITNEYPEGYVLSILVDGEEVLSVENSTVIHTFTVSRRTPSLPITCKAHITGNLNISRSDTQTLEVHYPPEFTETLCPSTLLLVEGRRTFSCRADGNPEPTVKCYSGKHNISDSGTVTRDMSGIYKCQATNTKGDKLKDVNVTVQYAPLSPIVTLSTNATIQAGNPLNITCESDGLPAPTYSWQLPNNAKVIYSPDNSSIIIHTAADTHNGTYTCLARNTHGEAKSNQEVTIKPVEFSIAWIVAIVVGSVVLVFAAIICYLCWKKGRRGFYHLLNAHHNRKPDNNIPTSSQNNKTTGV
ncbi:intercellular adhesion molecule 1-like [Phyllobates terribilis]|uniref:intercellular adhesion molecule 1-like n=1 Tax=Phyllobates terribilis TaxID=111132 RepID=UPI003CCB3CD1